MIIGDRQFDDGEAYSDACYNEGVCTVLGCGSLHEQGERYCTAHGRCGELWQYCNAGDCYTYVPAGVAYCGFCRKEDGVTFSIEHVKIVKDLQDQLNLLRLKALKNDPSVIDQLREITQGKPKKIIKTEDTMANQGVVKGGGVRYNKDQAKSEAKQALYLAGAKKVTKLVRKRLTAALRKSKVAPETMETVSALLDTEAGELLLAMIAAGGVTMFQHKLGEEAQEIARNMRIRAMMDGGELLFDTLASPILDIFEEVQEEIKGEVAAIEAKDNSDKKVEIEEGQVEEVGAGRRRASGSR